MSEFAHAPRARKKSQHDPTPDPKEADSSTGGNTPTVSSPPAETARNGRGTTHTIATDAIGSLSPPAPASATPTVVPAKSGQVPEGYHIFESLSKANKNGSLKQEEEVESEVMADQSGEKLVERGEKEVRHEESVNRRVKGSNGNAEEDAASVYSDDR